jgi:hypothetical protein
MSEHIKRTPDHALRVSLAAASVLSMMTSPIMEARPEQALKHYATAFRNYVEFGLSKIVKLDLTLDRLIRDADNISHHPEIVKINRPPPVNASVEYATTMATTTTAAPLSIAQIAAKEVPAYVYAEWKKVNICEQGGNWHVQGDVSDGGLGISNVNWVAFGGLKYAPNGAEATDDEQILVAEKIDPTPPDQNGCDGPW